MPTWEMICGQGSALALSASTTYYFSIPGAIGEELQTTEANAQLAANAASTLANFFVRASANATTADSTARSRVGGANGNMSVTIIAGTTGAFEDTTNTDSLAAGNLYNAQVVVGAGGTLTLTIIATTLQDTASNLAILASTSSPNLSADGLFPVSGISDARTPESNSQYPFRAATTLSNMRIRISANTRDGTSTVRTRVNGANGAQSVSIAANTTGTFEDSTNTDTVVAGDLVNYQLAIGGTIGSMSIAVAQLRSNSVERQLVCANPGSPSTAVDRYVVAEGRLAFSFTTETETQRTARTGFRARNMAVRVPTAGAHGGSSVYLRQNGANTVLTVTVGDNTTGLFEDTTNTVNIVAGDTYNYLVDHGGGAGAFVCSFIGIEQAQAVTAAGARSYPRGPMRGVLRGVA